MKFKVRCVSHPSRSETVTISSLEELKKFSKEKGYRLVIDFEEMLIWIADDYLDTI